jgi:putative oxidoreductase
MRMFGLLILQHGFSKWFGFPNPAPANIQLLTMVGIAGVIELIAGALLTVGLFTIFNGSKQIWGDWLSPL